MAQSICIIDGCEGVVLARGWCGTHYCRWKRHGDVNYRGRGQVVNGKRICSKCKADKLVEEFTPGASGCRVCIAAIKKAKPRPSAIPSPPVYCVECGTIFLPYKRQNICCSSACAASRKQRFDRVLSSEYDSEVAKANNRRWYATHKDTAYRSSANYRARKHAAFVEDVDRQIVFARDNWICQLCGNPVDRDARWPNPNMASLDHRIPLVGGGQHSYANTQTACLYCNISKGAKMPA
jgi:5-methylcytosine-specific restriction endonuclease McrA